MTSRRATDLLLDAAQEAARRSAADRTATLLIGEVVAVDAVGKSITVDLLGGEVPGVPYLKSYTPAVNDVVWLLQQNSLLIALGSP